MWDQEKQHLSKFNEILAENRVRPTLLLPLWNIAGFALGKCDLYSTVFPVCVCVCVWCVCVCGCVVLCVWCVCGVVCVCVCVCVPLCQNPAKVIFVWFAVFYEKNHPSYGKEHSGKIVPLYL